jgi:hypothetical protein
VRVHLAREHALELELRDLALETRDVLLDGADHALVGVGLGEFEQFAGLAQPGAETVERTDDRLEPGALAPEFLGTLRVLPDRRVLELPQDLGESLAAPVVVKDTP